MVKYLVALIALFPLSALAGSVTLTWTAPTKNTDGSNISGAVTYNVYGAIQGQTKVKLTATPISALTYTHNAATGGNTWCYTATSLVGGQESAQTAEVCGAVPAPIPNPPGNLTITSAVAYYMVQQKDTPVMLAVGTVPPNAGLNTSITMLVGGATYCAATDSKVLQPFNPKTTPGLIWAKCS